MEENIIPIVMFVVALLVTLMKKPNQKKSKEPPLKEKKKKTTGINEMMDRLKQQMLEALEIDTPKSSRPASEWERIQGTRGSASSVNAKKIDPSLDIDPDEGIPIKPLPDAPVNKQKKDPSEDQKERPRCSHRPSAMGLKEAIVWSEILLPPIALRDEQKHRE